MPLVSDVAARAQVALGDPLGDYWNISNPSSAGWLLPFINTANRSLARAFRTNNVRFSRGRAIVNVIQGLTAIDRTTAPSTLPSDFLQPYELWEKNLGDPDTSYVLMKFVSGQLPDLPQGSSLLFWDWFSNQIVFIGATTVRAVRVDYMRGIVDFTVASQALQIDDSLDALAYIAAGEAAFTVGQSQLGASLVEKGTQMIDGLVTAEIMTMQQIPRRRSAPVAGPIFTGQ